MTARLTNASRLISMMMVLVRRVRVALSVRMRVLRMTLGGHVGVRARVNLDGEGLGLDAVAADGEANTIRGWNHHFHCLEQLY